MEAILALIFVALTAWILIKVIQWLWPLIKFGALFIGAFFVLGSWFMYKEHSGLSIIIGAVVVMITAFNYAKNNSK